MSNERSNSNSRGDDHRVSLSYPPGRKARGALHHSQSNRSLAVVAAAVALLCLSSPSQQLQLRHHHRHGHGDGHGHGVVLASASSKHVPPPSRSFLGIRSSSRTQPPCRGGNNNNNNINPNTNTNTPQSLPRCRSDLATGHSRSVLRFSATPDEEPEYEQQREQDQERDSDRSSASSSSFNTTSLSSSTSTYIGGKSGIEEDDDDEDDDESRVTTTSFFELPSAAHQEPQELPGSSADDRRRRPIFSFRRQDSAVFAVQKLKQKQKKQQQQQQQLLPQQVQNRFVWSLMGIAGFVEGFCIRQYGCFPNLMTGTILKLAEAVGSLNLSTAGFYASMVLAYMAGGSIVAMWKSSPQYRSSGGSGGNGNGNTNNGVDPKRSLLEGVSVLSAMCFVVSDLASASTIARASVLKLPLLATAFGIVNAGTMDAGAGVTNAMTGHVSKIGQGLVNSSGIGGGIGGGSPHLASAKGMGIFWAAAVLSNLVCAAIEIEAGSITGGHHHAFALATTTAARWLSAKVPLGTTLAVVYGMLFRWYLGASAKAAKAAAAEKTKIA